MRKDKSEGKHGVAFLVVYSRWGKILTEDSGLKPGDKAVAFYLVTHMDFNQVCHCSQSKIASSMGWTTERVRQALVALEERRYIERFRPSPTVNLEGHESVPSDRRRRANWINPHLAWRGDAEASKRERKKSDQPWTSQRLAQDKKARTAERRAREAAQTEDLPY